MNVTEGMNTTLSEVRDIYRHGAHFIGVTCGKCKATANVAAPRPGWFCPCGHFNVQSFRGEGEWPHPNPKYGPTAQVLQQAVAENFISSQQGR